LPVINTLAYRASSFFPNKINFCDVCYEIAQL
jgi:hypothetical protein